jgi:hypothetical protein
MTIPTPADTDLMADAAYWIRAFSEYVESTLGTNQAVVPWDSGVVTTDGNGMWSTPASSLGLASVAGAVAIAYFDYALTGDAPAYDQLYIPVCFHNTDVTNALSLVTFEAPRGIRRANRKMRIGGLVWGPKAALAADAPAPAVNPGDTWPAGATAHGIHYPGTSDPQYKTADYIGTMADDVGASLGGTPLGITFAQWSGNLQTSSSGNAQVILPASALSRIRGLFALSMDATGGYPQARIFMAYIPDPSSTAEFLRTINVNVYNNQPHNAGANNWYNATVNNAAVGATILCWGDPPVS